jgi:CheY-like chemotaxis protein
MNQERIARILVADDEPQMQLALKASLTRAGYDLVVVADGARALEKLEQESFDLVISDQRMPEVTGQELLAQMQKRELGIPFIMITAHGTVTQAVEAMQLGAADFIAKPDAGAYERFFDRLKVDPQRAALFEDIDRNLIVPHQHGMTTILVLPAPGEKPEREDWEISEGSATHIDFVTDDLVGFLEALSVTG